MEIKYNIGDRVMYIGGLDYKGVATGSIGTVKQLDDVPIVLFDNKESNYSDIGTCVVQRHLQLIEDSTN